MLNFTPVFLIPTFCISVVLPQVGLSFCCFFLEPWSFGGPTDWFGSIGIVTNCMCCSTWFISLIKQDIRQGRYRSPADEHNTMNPNLSHHAPPNKLFHQSLFNMDSHFWTGTCAIFLNSLAKSITASLLSSMCKQQSDVLNFPHVINEGQLSTKVTNWWFIKRKENKTNRAGGRTRRGSSPLLLTQRWEDLAVVGFNHRRTSLWQTRSHRRTNSQVNTAFSALFQSFWLVSPRGCCLATQFIGLDFLLLRWWLARH